MYVHLQNTSKGILDCNSACRGGNYRKYETRSVRMYIFISNICVYYLLLLRTRIDLNVCMCVCIHLRKSTIVL